MDTLQLYEVLQQPRTVSRDSGYTTPSPMFGNVSAEDNRKVCHNSSVFLCVGMLKQKQTFRCWCGKGRQFLSIMQQNRAIYQYLHYYTEVSRIIGNYEIQMRKNEINGTNMTQTQTHSIHFPFSFLPFLILCICSPDTVSSVHTSSFPSPLLS
jgi:hypothetical protein